jgi:hypothetical protein
MKIEKSTIWFSGDSTSIDIDYVDVTAKKASIACNRDCAYVIDVLKNGKVIIGGGERIKPPYVRDDSTRAVLTTKAVTIKEKVIVH